MVRVAMVVLVLGLVMVACTRRNPLYCNVPEDCPGEVCDLVNHACVGLPDADERVDYIAFVSNRDGNNEIYRMKPDGTEQINLTMDPGNDYAPVWDPTGEHIAFLSDRRGGTPNLFVMRSDGSELVNVSLWLAQDPAWAPDGLTIAFMSTLGGGTNIYSARLSGGAATQLTTIGEALTPDWSPTGTRISYTAGASLSLWTMDSNGQNATDLMSMFTKAPRWSPDGTRFAFVARNFKLGGDDVWFINFDGSGTVTNVTMTGGISESQHQWSPDGSTILGKTSQDEIFLLDVATLAYTNLTMSSALDDSPGWSPDGNQVVFSSDRDGNNDIFVMARTGGTPTNLTVSPGSDTSPSWRPTP